MIGGGLLVPVPEAPPAEDLRPAFADPATILWIHLEPPLAGILDVPGGLFVWQDGPGVPGAAMVDVPRAGAVAEPASWFMLVVGAAGVLLLRWRNTR